MREVTAFLALAAAGGRFFDRGEVDFWGSRKRVESSGPGDLWADSAAPPPARRLLEAPTAENARAYLAWQRLRLERLKEALGALEKARREEVPDAPILYFARAGCRWCELQEAELEGLPVARVPEGSPLWKVHGVTATPTLVAGGRVFRGLTPRRVLLRELGRE
jgi:hypothetical protein